MPANAPAGSDSSEREALRDIIRIWRERAEYRLNAANRRGSAEDRAIAETFATAANEAEHIVEVYGLAGFTRRAQHDGERVADQIEPLRAAIDAFELTPPIEGDERCRTFRRRQLRRAFRALIEAHPRATPPATPPAAPAAVTITDTMVEAAAAVLWDDSGVDQGCAWSEAHPESQGETRQFAGRVLQAALAAAAKAGMGK